MKCRWEGPAAKCRAAFKMVVAAVCAQHQGFVFDDVVVPLGLHVIGPAVAGFEGEEAGGGGWGVAGGERAGHGEGADAAHLLLGQLRHGQVANLHRLFIRARPQP